MVQSQVLQNSLSFCRQPHVYFPPVLVPVEPVDQPSLHQPVHQFNCAVVLDLQTLRKICNPWRNTFGHSLDGEQQLMVMRLEPRMPGSFLAQAQETSYLIPKVRQSLVVRGLQVMVDRHKRNYIVSRYYFNLGPVAGGLGGGTSGFHFGANLQAVTIKGLDSILKYYPRSSA